MIKIKHDKQSSQNLLLNSFKHFSDIISNQLDKLITFFSFESSSKIDIIIVPNAVKNNKFYFIVSEFAGIYYNAKSKKNTSYFKERNSLFVKAYTIFKIFSNVDCRVALEETFCLIANCVAIKYLFQKYHSIKQLGIKKIETYHATFIKTNFYNLFLTAEEQNEIVLRNHSTLSNIVSKEYVFSYLEMIQETFSRLRSGK